MKKIMISSLLSFPLLSFPLFASEKAIQCYKDNEKNLREKHLWGLTVDQVIELCSSNEKAIKCYKEREKDLRTQHLWGLTVDQVIKLCIAHTPE